MVQEGLRHFFVEIFFLNKHVQEIGYGVVQTKTMNKWRNMLVLNIKNGFDVIDTYFDEKGLHKIVLEKKLLNYRVQEYRSNA